jgi:hypothetical protein
VHINNDKSVDGDDLILSEPLAHKHDSLNQLLVLSIQIISDALSSIGFDGFFNLGCPVNLTAIKNALARVADDPIIP